MKKPKGWCPCGRYVTLRDNGTLYKHLDRGTDDWCTGGDRPALPAEPAGSVQTRELELVRGLTARIEQVTIERDHLAAQRAEIIMRLHDRGLSYREIARLVGLSSPRISQITALAQRRPVYCEDPGCRVCGKPKRPWAETHP